MKRADWVKIKAEATKLNGGKPVKFPKDMKLGEALDAYWAAEKKRGTVDIGKDAQTWAAVNQKWLLTRKIAINAVQVYDAAIDKLQATKAAKDYLENAIYKGMIPISSGPGNQLAAKVEAALKKVEAQTLAAAKAKREAERATK